MELQIAFLVTGILIVAVAIFRIRKIPEFSAFQTRLEETYDVTEIDLSGETEYTNCFAHEWVYDNMTIRKHGRMGNAFQSYLMSNTLAAAIWIGLLMGMISVIVGFLFIEGIQTLGVAIVVFMAGILVMIGPGEPRVSEELLDALIAAEYSRLCKNDFVYVKIAVDSIKKWGIINLMIGISCIAIFPVGDLVPSAIAWSIAAFSNLLLWGPAFFLADFSLLLALLYLAGVIPFLIYLFTRIIAMISKRGFLRTSDEFEDYDDF